MLDLLPYHPIEKVVLETRASEWVVCSIGSCGILTRALIGRHAKEYGESKGRALTFAHQAVRAIGLVPAHDRLSTSQILVDLADVLVDDPEHVQFLATTWQYLPEGVEICSVGSNAVLVIEGESARDVVTPHTVIELLRRQGHVLNPGERKRHRMQVTHALGAKTNQRSCRVEDVQVALVPWFPSVVIAICEERLLADMLLAYPKSGPEISSFIEAWSYSGRRTSVLISWEERKGKEMSHA
jgi:hypothetical protein